MNSLSQCQTADAGNIKNLLDYYDIKLDEALIFGIAGGIGAGYSFCPSVPRHGTGSGVSIVGRHDDVDTQGHYYQRAFQRLGIKTHIAESKSVKAAENNLLQALEKNQPTLVWCSGVGLPYLALATPLTTCGWMRTVLVTGLKNDAFMIYDQAQQPFVVNKTDLAQARNGVCSHKNRLMTIMPGKTKALDQAVASGLSACVVALQQPRIKMFSLLGLGEWAKMITNATNQRGWRKVFSPYFLYLALRDVFISIETQGTGGGLYRPIFAQFLSRAAEILSQPKLLAVAQDYQELGALWTQLAQAALPESIKPFNKIKQLMAQQHQKFCSQGGAGIKALSKYNDQIRIIEAQIKQTFPLNQTESADLLADLQSKIRKLHDKEQAAIEHLAGMLADVKASETKITADT